MKKGIGFGSAPKCHGSPTLGKRLPVGVNVKGVRAGFFVTKRRLAESKRKLVPRFFKGKG